MKITDRVQAHTADHVNELIHEEARGRVREAAADSPARISERIEELDREWDIERWLETNASAIALGAPCSDSCGAGNSSSFPVWCCHFSFSTRCTAGARPSRYFGGRA